ncbi:energy transducer TonB [Odoribacter lunatus]|uniref:energy transducer TonB n=1 Tax=Odoribacter lunatus TaxID=2941335 RepID=UPI00203D5587|nr:energy transducer TonB [Odoribacter lunatus]
MMKIIFLLALLATICTAFGQGQTPHSESFDVVKYVEDYIKENMKKPTPQGEFETKSEWEERVRKEKYEQRKELMHEALYKLYGSPFEKKVNLRLGQYDIEHECFPMETNGLGSYALPSSKDDGPKWRALWNSGKFSIRNTYKYGVVNGKPRLVFLPAIKDFGSKYTNTDQGIYFFDKETGKFIEFVWSYGSWGEWKKFKNFVWDYNKWIPGEMLKREEAKKKEEEKYGNEIFDEVDQMPQFNGNINRWLKDNLKYPVKAHENGIMGRVLVAFVIEKDGSITDVEVVESVDPSLDEEAVRVVKTMSGKWTPGKIDGIPVRVACAIPINFTLSN